MAGGGIRCMSRGLDWEWAPVRDSGLPSDPARLGCKLMDSTVRELVTSGRIISSGCSSSWSSSFSARMGMIGIENRLH